MKTGIIIYSQSGHTRQAAQKLLEALRAKGREAELLEVKASNTQPEMNASLVQLTNKPEVEAYDQLVFASPVWGFSLSRVMKVYLEGLPSLKGKKISLFVTHQLPLPWMGGNNAIRQMEKLCEEKGGQVTARAVICWGKKRRERDLSYMLKKLG
jgi:NAD(P)H dehydrogenase (quinone)